MRKEGLFEEILMEFCNDNKISGWRKDFKDIRNGIIHTGEVKGTNVWERYRESTSLL